VRSPSHSLVTSLNAVTLSSIPALRSIANDVIFDVLMYLTPEYCEAILQSVTSQINELYHKFHNVHPSFKSIGGRWSLVGHSLGSVIAWDILSILKDNLEKNLPKGDANDPIRIEVPSSPTRVHSLMTLDNADTTEKPMSCQALAENDRKHGTWGPCLSKKMVQTIPFTPDLMVFLGSPIGLFLTLRGAHPIFDQLRAVAEAERAKLIPCDNEEEETPRVFDVSPIICSPFTLPVGALYNIFHPR
jgi:phospholipase DDHD2